MATDKYYILGIDLGTTSIKVALLDPDTREVVNMQSRDATAQYASSEACRHEQDINRLLTTLHLLMASLPQDRLGMVRHIISCGQMHGLILWKRGAGWTRSQYGRLDADHCSRIVTWMDRRCDQEFLATLPDTETNVKVSTGYGCATLFWYARHHPELVSNPSNAEGGGTEMFNCAGTAVDFLVAMLANLDRPVMSVQMAASWGYFNDKSLSWETERLASHGFPCHLLPRVALPGHQVGVLDQSWGGVPAGAAVYVGLGDVQCSVYSCLLDPQCAAINLSTSAQLCFRHINSNLPATQTPACDANCTNVPTLSLLPYFFPDKGEKLAVAASLTGGNVLERFVRMLRVWIHELGSNALQDSQIWSRLSTLGEEATNSFDLQIIPTLFGERHCPEQRASVTNIRTESLGLGSVYRALCLGMITNLASMVPKEALREAGVKRLVCSGGALLKNSVLQSCLTEVFSDLTVEIADGKEACVGAAMFISDWLQDSRRGR